MHHTHSALQTAIPQLGYPYPIYNPTRECHTCQLTSTNLSQPMDHLTVAVLVAAENSLLALDWLHILAEKKSVEVLVVVGQEVAEEERIRVARIVVVAVGVKNSRIGL